MRVEEFYDDNTLVYVALHELAHTRLSHVGHGEPFEDLFRRLLRRAASLGVYRPEVPVDPSYPRASTGVSIG